jgi:DNA polymerase-3 subunit alpha
MEPFVHLHVHSEYSLLDGLSSCAELAGHAAQMGMPALALTDHGVMYGAVKFYKACQAAGIKPIIGMETYVAHEDRHSRDARTERKPHHLVLLAQNERGYKNLLHLSTTAQLDGFYYKPRIDKAVLAERSEGLIALSGCGSSEIAQSILDGRLDAAREAATWYHDLLPGRYFLEIQDHAIPELADVNRHTIALARELDIPLVATNDVHYARREQSEAHDVLLCIQTGKTVNEPKRMRMYNDSFYLRSAEEMAALFPDVPDALENTRRIADMCEIELEFGNYHLPVFEVPEGYDAQSYLRHLCEEGLKQRYDPVTEREWKRLDYELDIIHKMGFDTYFLIVWDLCRFSKEQNIWWNVRGSGASSIVAYSLGVTHLEPLQHGLIFERFLNVGRVTMPDIDLDYPDDQRADLIEYTIEKYGHDQVAQIITFGTMGAKAAIRDVGRALDYPLPDVDRVARLVPTGPKVKLDRSLQEVSELREAYETQDHVRRLIDTARGVEGNIRHASTHAAGVIVTDVPLVNYTPLHRPTSSAGEEIGVVTQYEMEELEQLGLLKVDFLGLSTLTIMRRACELIRRRHGVALDLNSIPTGDESIYRLLSSGDVTGVFQVEGQGMRRVLMKLQPTQFDHVIATISLFRPGPMEYIDDYIDRLHGRKEIEYRHPSLKPILEETYGIIVYQEQIIRILTDIAGYTAGDADLVRRAVGKKKKKELLKHRATFIEGAVEQGGLPREAAEGIFADIEYFARYGFNKSHAADYAVLTCQTAYLRANYPVEYMAALLSVERNKTEKVGLLIAECRRMGIEVLPPDVNRSGLDFTIEEGPQGDPAIRFGLGAVKNVGEGPVEAILEARETEGPFADLDDFCRRVDMRQVNRRALESLVKVGTLRPFGTCSQLLPIMDQIIGLSANLHRARDVGQMSLFGEVTGVHLSAEESLLPDLSSVPEVPQKDILAWEKELVGVYVSEHPLTETLLKFQDVVTAQVESLTAELSGQQVVLAGMVQRVRRHTTRKGDDMAFVTLEGVQGTCDVVVFPRVWERTREKWIPERILVISGKVDAGRREQPSILCDWVKTPDQVVLPSSNGSAPAVRVERPAPRRVPAAPPPPPPPSSPAETPVSARTVRVILNRSGQQERDVEKLRRVYGLLVEHPGPDAFFIKLVGGPAGAVELAFPNEKTRYSPELLHQLTAMLGPDSVQLEPHRETRLGHV